MSGRPDPRSVLFLVERRDGAVRVAGQHAAWGLAGHDPRECLGDGQSSEAARGFGRWLADVCADAVARWESANA